MKVQLRQVKEAENVLAKILTFQMEPKLAYRMSKIAKKLVGLSRDIEKRRIALVELFGAQKDDGTKEVPKEKTEEFQKKFDEYLEGSVEIEGEQIPFALLKSIKLSAYDIAMAEPFITEPTEEELSDDKSEVEVPPDRR